jgi:hypothetical protein
MIIQPKTPDSDRYPVLNGRKRLFVVPCHNENYYRLLYHMLILCKAQGYFF